MQIIQYTSDYEEQYKKFLSQNDRLLLFYSLKYLNFLLELLNTKNETLLAIDNNAIVGILPLLSKKGKFGKVLNSLPFYGSNGFIVAINDNVSEALLKHYNDIILGEDIFSSTIITNPLLSYNCLSKVKHNFDDFRIGQITKLENVHTDQLMDIFHSKTRNMVRKALKLGIEISIENDSFDFLEKVHNENMAEIGGKAKSPLFFELLKKHFLPSIDYDIYVAKRDGEYMAALLVLYFNKTVEYFTPVVKIDYRSEQPLSAIIYIAMQDAIRKGYKFWNWGGTWASQDGVYRFKSRWGAEDITYQYYTYANIEHLKLTTKEQLLEEYENFYVVPFSALKD